MRRRGIVLFSCIGIAESVSQTYERCIDLTMAAAASSKRHDVGGRVHGRDFGGVSDALEILETA